MKNIKKILVLLLTTSIILSAFSSNVLGTTTIDDSAFPAEVGDFFSWKCTYSHTSFDSTYGLGSYHNITIDNIYRGSASTGGFIEHALIVDVTEGRYLAGLDQYDVWSEVYYIVYNNSVDHLYMEDDINPIVPIPLNMSLIAKSAEASTGSCVIDGNTITWEIGAGDFYVYTFNTNGLATTWKYIENDETMIIFKLENGEVQNIPFGIYFIIPSICTIVCLVMLIKKRGISDNRNINK